MVPKVSSSILRQLALTIAGASVIAAIASTLGHYFFTAKVIQRSTDQQIQSALELTTDYLEKNYTEKLKYDLNLLESSQEINAFLSSPIDEYLIHQLNVEKLLLSFSGNRSDLYHSIRLLDVSGSELAIIEEQKRVRKYNTIIMSGNSEKINAMGNLFLELKTSKPGSVLFGGPAFENGKSYFFVGIAKTDPDIGGFGGAVIITFTLEQLTKYLNNFKVFGHSLVWLYDSEGELIYRGDIQHSVDPFPYIFGYELVLIPDTEPLPESGENEIVIKRLPEEKFIVRIFKLDGQFKDYEEFTNNLTQMINNKLDDKDSSTDADLIREITSNLGYAHTFKKETKPKDLTILSASNADGSSISGIVKTFIVLPPEARNQLLKNLGSITALILTSIIFTSLVLAYLMAKRIVHPIRRLTYMSKKVAAGDFSVKMPVKGQDEISSLSQTFNTMTSELEQKRIELTTMANKDTLTKLPNRRQFEAGLIQSIKNCQRNKEAIALIYIDLDQFKDTNDSFGHPAGDKLIQDVAKRLSNAVRQTDLVARLGGDEFAIVLHQHKSRFYTEGVAKKILHSLKEPFDIEGHQIFSSASIGISLYPDHGTTVTELVKNADAAMYKAKQMGRNNYQFYEAQLTNSSNERLLLGAEIRRALENDQLEIYFQPKVCMQTEEIVGAEALLRWVDDNNDDIAVTKIIEIAESSGFIDQLDTWVFTHVFMQLHEWEELGISIIPISINISGKLLEHDRIVELIKKSIAYHPIKPGDIEIEITENHLIRNMKQTQKALEFLHNFGISLAIDDFGTGYSSLAYLKDISADTLKIDRKFIVNSMESHSDKAIATAIIQLASSLDMHVVVEGIETKDQADFFKKLGAHSAQGFYYYYPLSPKDFTDLLLSQKRRKQVSG